MDKRVVITGMGVISPVGNDVNTFWKNLCEGYCGIDYITEYPTDELPGRIAGRIHGECWETAAPTATPAVNITDSASILFASAICEISNYFVYLHGYSENKTKPQ